jgi:hypothetical protein
VGEEPDLSGVGEGRRAFLKRLLVAGFAVPLVATFSTSGIEAAFAQSANNSGAGSQPTNEVNPTPTSTTTTTTTLPPSATTTTTAPTTTTAAPTTTTTTTTLPATTTTTQLT